MLFRSTVLALVEAFAAAGRHRRTIDFVAYGAEEYGRHTGNLGAVAYVRANTSVVRQTLALVEVDCVGTVASPLRVSFFAWPASHRTEKRAEILGLLRTLPDCVVDDLSENPSATTAFHLPGVPSILFLDEYDRLPIHTAQDTIDLMRPEAFARTVESVIATVQHLAS